MAASSGAPQAWNSPPAHPAPPILSPSQGSQIPGTFQPSLLPSSLPPTAELCVTRLECTLHFPAPPPPPLLPMPTHHHQTHHLPTQLCQSSHLAPDNGSGNLQVGDPSHPGKGFPLEPPPGLTREAPLSGGRHRATCSGPRVTGSGSASQGPHLPCTSSPLSFWGSSFRKPWNEGLPGGLPWWGPAGASFCASPSPLICSPGRPLWPPAWAASAVSLLGCGPNRGLDGAQRTGVESGTESKRASLHFCAALPPRSPGIPPPPAPPHPSPLLTKWVLCSWLQGAVPGAGAQPENVVPIAWLGPDGTCGTFLMGLWKSLPLCAASLATQDGVLEGRPTHPLAAGTPGPAARVVGLHSGPICM